MDPERWRKIEELYHLALEQEPAQQNRFLAEACQGDAELREEVESLLAHSGGTERLVDKTAWAEADDAAATRTVLTLGARLGPYQILGLLGEGGMGKVYRGLDTRLDRTVAIKVSKDKFSERFEREARAVAALNHPHICTLYDVGPDYLVMEFVEGAPLKGPLPLERSVEYAGQILEALDAAHCKRITHRDLKPGNILVTKQGIKLLDFGIAKRSDPLQETGATPTAALTDKGQILGTLQYMSPEQLQGGKADARSDLFSFGCVLYEMLTGKRAFEGQSAASVIAAILEREPAPLVEVPPLERVVRRCLAKDPDQRFQTARDLKAALNWAVETPLSSTVAKARSRVPWTVAGALTLVAAVSLWVAWRSTRPVEPTPQPLVRLDVDLGSDVVLGSVRGADVIISPDATRLVYVSQNRLFTRRLDQAKATELPGTEGAFAPFFSPDGRSVAFFTPAKLKKISLDGGTASDLCDSSSSGGGSWGEDGTIIAALNFSRALERVPAAGGAPHAVTEMAPGESSQRRPQILPGGKAVLFTRLGGTNGSSIEVLNLGDGRRKSLVQGSDGRYLPASRGAGYLLYVSRGTLFAVPFDPDRLEMRGTPAIMVQDVSYSATFGAAQYAFARNGTLLYRSGAGGGLLTLQWLDSFGNVQPLLAKPGAYVRPRLSPDGRRIALEIGDGSQIDIWAYDLQRETMTRLTFGGGANMNPIWTPDGRHIVFTRLGGMFWTDGAGKTQPLTRSQDLQFPFSFSPDGKWIAFYESSPESGRDLWVLPVEEDAAGLRAGKPEIFLQTKFDERAPAFSPDGRWLAYASDESGRAEVYVQAFPRPPSGSGGKWQVSNNGGDNPAWSSNGRELFFHGLDERIMVAAYSAKGSSFSTRKPRPWSEKRLANIGILRNYDVAPDGKRVLALAPGEGTEGQSSQSHVTFLLNFFDELRRRAPTGGK